MKGEAKPFVKYLEGSNTRFIIPVYQRNYDWKRENCRQLFDDLEKVMKEKRGGHFFGSIVEVCNIEGGSGEFLIIDGQQRITTISLLLLAMVNLLKEGKIQSKKEDLAALIETTYLVDKWQPVDKKIKLKPVKNDQEAFLKLFDTKEDYILTSNITSNYQYFYDRILREGLDADELHEAIRKLNIIDISLSPIEDDAQLIFESLNSTGLDLSEADKVRNYVLMGQPIDLQEKLYNMYWHKVEENTQYQVSEFTRFYLTVKIHRFPNINNVYIEFKQYAEKCNLSMEELLADMLKYSVYEKHIDHPSDDSDGINVVINRFNLLEVGVSRPYLLTLFAYREQNGLPNDDFVSILETLETYIFRRIICDVPTNALNKIFATLHADCLRYAETPDMYASVLRYILINRPGSSRCPKDTEFLRGIDDKDIYGMQAKNKMYLFHRLENEDSYERVNVIENMRDGTYSIEHIMPQTLSQGWKKALGAEWQNIYDTWINKLANLTLTAYNSKYKNRLFTEKKTIEHGFDHSGFRMNDFMKSCETWGEKELLQRNELLKKQALKMWPYPQSDFEPVIQSDESCFLDESCEYTGKTIISFTFMGTTYPVKSWKEMYVDTIRLLFDRDSTIIYRWTAEEKDKGIAAHFSGIYKNRYAKIADRAYLYTNSSSTNKIQMLRKIFDAYGIDQSELSIEMKGGSKDEDSPSFPASLQE